MSITIRRYTGGEIDAIWDQLVDSSPQGTVFHTRRFLSYHPADRFIDHSLLIFDGSNLLAVFPAAEVLDGTGAKILKSHPGSSYGGLVTHDNPPLEKCIELIGSLVAYATEHGFKTIEFRATERIFHSRPAEQMEYALLRSGFSRAYEEIGTYFDLEDQWDKSDEELIMTIPQKTRPPIRKGLSSGLQFRLLAGDDVLRDLHALITRNLIKHEATPTHSEAELLRLAQLFPDRILAFGIFEGPVLIGGFVLFEITPGKWHIFYSAMDYAYSKLSPLHFGLYQLLCWSRANRYKYLNYGISTEDRGQEINWGLLKFKESFGGNAVIRTYWVKSLQQL